RSPSIEIWEEFRHDGEVLEERVGLRQHRPISESENEQCDRPAEHAGTVESPREPESAPQSRPRRCRTGASAEDAPPTSRRLLNGAAIATSTAARSMSRMTGAQLLR